MLRKKRWNRHACCMFHLSDYFSSSCLCLEALGQEGPSGRREPSPAGYGVGAPRPQEGQINFLEETFFPSPYSWWY